MFYYNTIDLNNLTEIATCLLDEAESSSFTDALSLHSDKYKYLFDDSLFFDCIDDKTPALPNVCKNRMFYTMCDIISINFDKLSTDLFIVLCNSIILNNDTLTTAESIADTLTEFHPLLCNKDLLYELSYIYRDMSKTLEVSPYKVIASFYEPSSFIMEPFTLPGSDPSIEHRILSVINDAFRLIRLIIDYIDNLHTEEKLIHPDVFRLYVSQILGCRLIEFTPDDSFDDTVDYDDNEYGKLNLDNFLKLLNSKSSHLKVSCNNLIEYICSNIYYILNNNMTIKRCENCGKFFVAYNRSDTLYCDRKSPQDTNKTCKEYGTTKLWYDKLKDDETKKLYRNIYQQKQMLVRRNPDIYQYRADFENFKAASKEWKQKVKDGTAAESDYLQWLKDVKKRKVTYNGNSTKEG
jgi:hypothetical protein